MTSMEIRFKFQPIIDLNSRKAIGYEALLRCGDVSPVALFGRVQSLGRETAFDLECARRAVTAAKELPAGMTLFINLRSSTIKALAEGSARLSLPKGSRPLLVFELTDTSDWPETYADCEKLIKAIQPFGDLCLDNVGKGWTNNKRVNWLRPRWLKLSMSLLHGAEKDAAKQSLIRNIVRIGKNLNANIVGLGIEQASQWAYCRTLGAGYGQGFLFSPPSEDYKRT